jgi:hypothetical protein
MKSTASYCHSQRLAFQFLPGSCIVHTWVALYTRVFLMSKCLSQREVFINKCLQTFIQPFLGRTSMRMQRKFVNSADNCCYVCGEVTFSSQKRAITPIIWKAYHFYFGCQIGDQDRSWAPHICCNTCAANLRKWLSRKRRSVPFAVPLVYTTNKQMVNTKQQIQ